MEKPTIYRSVSFLDLEKAGYKVTVRVVGGMLKVKSAEKDGRMISLSELNKALKFLGLRINHRLSIEEKCEHIPISGGRYYGYRFLGEERGDQEWLKSGYASNEAKEVSSGMGDMVYYLQRMRNGGDRK